MSLSDLLTADRIRSHLPEPGTWRPFPAVSDRAAWSRVPERARAELLAAAERMHDQPWPLLTGSLFARFARDGDRAGYERPYFARRARLTAFVLAAGLAGDDRWLDPVLDGIWLLCEETSWCLPAHHPPWATGTPLPEPGAHHLDLFAAETGAVLAWTALVLGERIEPIARDRLRREVRQRVLHPYRGNARQYRWFANVPNNWNPWIHSNLLACALLLDESRDELVDTTLLAIEGLDHFLAGYPPDGGCDEGISYWWRAGASLAECLDTLRSASRGALDGFPLPLVREIACYPLRMHIAGAWYVNFGDGAPRAGDEVAPEVLYRLGTRLRDPEICAHARAMAVLETPGIGAIPSLGRILPRLFNPDWTRQAPPAGKFGEACEPNRGHSGEACEPNRGRSGEACEPNRGHSGEACEPNRGRSGEACEPHWGRSGEACGPDRADSGEASEPDQGRSGEACGPDRERFPLLGRSWLPDTEVFTVREHTGSTAGLFVAAKGGHNGEHHNHNDVGTFIVALDGRPMLIDAGVGVYTRATFDPSQRYTIWTMQSSYHNLPEVDGVPQQAGREFRATGVRGAPRELSLDIAAAYPPEAGITSWRRTVSLDGGEATIEDMWSLDHQPRRIALHLLTAEAVHVDAPGRLVLAGPRPLRLEYDPSALDTAVEELAIDDVRLAGSWGDRLHRIVLTVTRPEPAGQARLVARS